MIQINEQYLKYLKQLRANGIKSFVGATRFLEKQFKISNSKAKEIIKEYNREHGFHD